MDQLFSQLLLWVHSNPVLSLSIPLATGSLSLAAALGLRRLQLPIVAEVEPINEGVVLLDLPEPMITVPLAAGGIGSRQVQYGRDWDWVSWPTA